MYSPKIEESLIPRLYRLAKKWGIPMTVLVNETLREYLETFVAEGSKEKGVRSNAADKS